MGLTLYVGVALVVGVAVFVVATTTWLASDPDQGGIVARSVTLSVTMGILWTPALVLLLAWCTPKGRPWLIWFVEGPAEDQRYSEWWGQRPSKEA